MISFNGAFSSDDLDSTFRGLGRDVFFVQIGAMDGITHDPIHRHVVELGWHGLLVEPISYLNEKLQENYVGCEGLVFEKMAIADFNGHIEMSFLDPEAAAEGVFEPGAFGISTLMPDRGVISGKGISEGVAQLIKRYTKTIDVPCCKLTTLFATHQITALDLMVIDAEGADWMVVRQLSLDNYRPRLVYLEYNHLSDYEKTACAAHFHNYGYRIYLDQNNAENFLAVRSE